MEQPSGSEAERRAVEQVANAWRDAFNAHDLEAVAALYTADALLSTPGSPLVRGREAIADFLGPRMTRFEQAGLRVVDEPVGEAEISGDFAWHWQTFRILDAAEDEVLAGQLVTLFRRVAGRWLIAGDMSSPQSDDGGNPASRR